MQEFILDDSYSSNRYWQSMCGLLELLSFMVQDSDPDGIELRFANSRESTRSHDPVTLKAAAKRVKPEGTRDVGDVVEEVLNAYKGMLDAKESKDSRREPSSPVRPLSVYVLTDGENFGEGSAVAISGLVHRLNELDYPRKQVGVQFISFGRNEEKLERLRQMDVLSQTWGLPE